MTGLFCSANYCETPLRLLIALLVPSAPVDSGVMRGPLDAAAGEPWRLCAIRRSYSQGSLHMNILLLMLVCFFVVATGSALIVVIVDATWSPP